MGYWRRLYYVMGWDYPSDIASEKTKRQRHLVMEQIRNSKIKLRPTNKEIECIERLLASLEEQRKMLQPMLYDCDSDDTEEVDISEYN